MEIIGTKLPLVDGVVDLEDAIPQSEDEIPWEDSKRFKINAI